MARDVVLSGLLRSVGSARSQAAHSRPRLRVGELMTNSAGGIWPTPLPPASRTANGTAAAGRAWCSDPEVLVLR